MSNYHIPVILEDTIKGLDIKKDGIYVDGTIGGAGHSKEIVKRLSDKGKLIGIDRDFEALEEAKSNLKDFKNVELIHGNHDDIPEILDELNIDLVDGILLDLGVSSHQLDEEDRGFSYTKNSPLDMRMDKTQSLTAEIVINKYSEEELADIIYNYGEEKYSRSIARNIVKERKIKPITTTEELVKIIEKSRPHGNNGNPAKQTFQAIRIEVNNELKPLYNTVVRCIKRLKPGGRLAIITFHSLEDRTVKNAFNDMEGKCICPPGIPVCTCGNNSYGKVITKKPIIASIEEQEQNSRSKSAKLRVFERK